MDMEIKKDIFSKRELARCRNMDIAVYGKGSALLLAGEFCYESGSKQGCGAFIDQEFIVALMHVFNVNVFQEINNQPCFVTHDGNTIYKIEPLFPNEGRVFDISEWRKGWYERQKARKVK